MFHFHDDEEVLHHPRICDHLPESDGIPTVDRNGVRLHRLGSGQHVWEGKKTAEKYQLILILFRLLFFKRLCEAR